MKGAVRISTQFCLTPNLWQSHLEEVPLLLVSWGLTGQRGIQSADEELRPWEGKHSSKDTGMKRRGLAWHSDFSCALWPPNCPALPSEAPPHTHSIFPWTASVGLLGTQQNCHHPAFIAWLSWDLLTGVPAPPGPCTHCSMKQP